MRIWKIIRGEVSERETNTCLECRYRYNLCQDRKINECPDCWTEFNHPKKKILKKYVKKGLILAIEKNK